jgi:GAF domain-containing protein/anti-sigma regulatory factor (Ser/Thr protein kinase)
MAGALTHEDSDAATPPVGLAVAARRDASLAFLAALTTKLAVAPGEAEILGGFSLTAVERFCATCAIHLIGADGALTLGGFAHQPPEEAGRVYRAISRLVASKLGPLQQVSRAGDPVQLRADPGAQAPPAGQHRQGRYLLDAFEGGVLLLVPLLVATSVIGVVSFAPPRKHEAFDEAAVETATVAVRYLALALENARSIARERRVTERFGHLEKAKNALFATLEPEQMLQRVAESLVGPLAEGILVYSVDRERLQVIAAAHRTPETAALVAGLIGTQPLKPEAERLLLEHLRSHESVVTNILSHDDLQALFRPSSLPLVEALQPRAEIVVPFFANDVLAGAIVAYASRDDFGPSDVEVFEEIGRVSTLALDHARSFARERRLTKVLQEATLPAQLPTIKGAIVSAIYSPAATELKVGGDWYDAFSLDEDRVLLTIGDVTGHGLQASAIMSKLRHTLNAVALYETNPSAIIDAAEDVLLRRFPNGIATAFVGIYDSRDRSLVYSNAGHPWPIVRYEDGSLRELTGGRGLPIGLRWMAPGSGSIATASLEQAVLLVLYTDGLIEATRDPIEGGRLLEASLREDAALHVSAAPFIESCCVDGPAADDVTLLVLKFADAVRWAFDVDDVTMARRFRANFVAELKARVTATSDVDAAELIVGELLGNVRRHAPGHVDVAIEFVGHQAILHVVDRGSGLSGRRRTQVAPLSEGGRGLWLVQQLSRGLRIESFPRFGSHISAVLPVDIGERSPVEV